MSLIYCQMEDYRMVFGYFSEMSLVSSEHYPIAMSTSKVCAMSPKEVKRKKEMRLFSPCLYLK